MIQVETKPAAIQPVKEKTIQISKQPVLIQFELQSDEVQEFYSDYSSQVYDKEPSIISTETEKRKKQMRDKVNDYLNYRKSMGMANNLKKINYGDEEQDFEGDIVDQLGLIQGEEKKLGQTQQFILAFNKKPEQAISDYIKKGIIHNDEPETIAAYLIKIEALDKENLGKYFGENDQKVLKILHAYCKLLSLKKVQFDRALRTLLSRFRLPGQAQQIQRIVWQFSLAFFEENQEDYDNPDELFPLSYAIIMLATDAHNPKQQKKMKKQDFIKNTRGPCPSIPTEYLGKIYDRITTQKFETQVSDTQYLYMRLRDINTTDFQGTLKLTKQLKQGDVFLKVCRNTIKFVQRKIYLSNDEKRIYWVSDPPKEQQQPRFIEIKDIVNLTLGLGSEVMKKNKVPQEFDPMCFTIQTTHRTLDLKAKTNKQRAKWLNYIRAVLIKRREARIQELENAQNPNLTRGYIEEIWNTEIFPHWDLHWDYKNKKPRVRNVLVRGIQAICCCWRQKPKTIDGLEDEGNHHGLDIKTTKLQTLWKRGLPENSRKVLWPLVIGNNLALNATMIEQIKKRTKPDENLRQFVAFENQSIEMAEICRQFRLDIPPIRDLLLISQLFTKAIPKNASLHSNSQNNSTNTAALSAFLNLMHLYHFLAFYRGDKSEIDLRSQLFQFLLEKNALKVKKHFEVLKLEAKMYLVSWFLSGFADCFANRKQFLYRIWDNFLLEGQIYLFKVGITIVKYYQTELKMCTFHEGLKILRFPKNTSQILFFEILNNEINVKQEDFNNYIDMRKHAIIKTKVQAIPLQ